MAEYNLRYLFSNFKSSQQTLDINNDEDRKMIDEYNLKMYNHYLSSKKSKNDKLKDFDVTYDDDGNVVKVEVKPKHGKNTYTNYSYQITTRLLKDGTVKTYLTRTKQVYHYKKFKISPVKNKCKYLDLIKSSDNDLIVHDLDSYSWESDPNLSMYNYLKDNNIDVEVKNSIKRLLNDNELSNSKKSTEIFNVIQNSTKIPNDYKLSEVQVRSYVYRMNK